jgi:predicted ferric reductase
MVQRRSGLWNIGLLLIFIIFCVAIIEVASRFGYHWELAEPAAAVAWLLVAIHLYRRWQSSRSA